MKKKENLIMKRVSTVLLLVLCAGLATALAQTEAAPVATPVVPANVSTIDSGDTAWLLMSAALVMLMTPGLAFFYGGLVRRKNMLSILMQCFIVLAALSLQWVLIGYSLSFAPGNGFIGSLKWFALKGVGLEPNADYAATIPHQVFMIFQAMFAIITPALIIGSFAERMKFSAFLLFTLLWATLVYDPLAHMVWGVGGWLRNLGTLDFAGGTVVHINAGIAALVTAVIIGKRKNYDKHPTPPHNLPFSVLGAGLLWFGWFGFNAGSALGANGLAANAFVVTNTAAAAAALSWALLDWKFNGNPTMLGTISGAVAGLVAITPAAGYVGIGGAMAIGLMVSVFCFISVGFLKHRFGYDDSLDAFGIHGIGGIWGALATGIFATRLINPAGGDGLWYGHTKLFLIQLLAVVVTIFYTFIVTFIIYKLVDLLMGVRIADEEESIGLDLTQHNERAYTMLE
jgi:Amt family ammonium transporter